MKLDLVTLEIIAVFLALVGVTGCGGKSPSPSKPQPSPKVEQPTTPPPTTGEAAANPATPPVVDPVKVPPVAVEAPVDIAPAAPVVVEVPAVETAPVVAVEEAKPAEKPAEEKPAVAEEKPATPPATEEEKPATLPSAPPVPPTPPVMSVEKCTEIATTERAKLIEAYGVNAKIEAIRKAAATMTEEEFKKSKELAAVVVNSPIEANDKNQAVKTLMDAFWARVEGKDNMSMAEFSTVIRHSEALKEPTAVKDIWLLAAFHPAETVQFTAVNVETDVAANTSPSKIIATLTFELKDKAPIEGQTNLAVVLPSVQIIPYLVGIGVLPRSCVADERITALNELNFVVNEK